VIPVPTTPQDWRVTAADEARHAMTELAIALDEPAEQDGPVPSLAEVLAHMWRAAQAAHAAVGALVTAEVRAGMSWDEVARALGFAGPDEARQAMTDAMAAGDRRLHDRLPYS
jgi:hypothetical protein